MSTDATANYLQSLVTELRNLPTETGWVEFKQNNADPELIGHSIAALSNSAALEDKANAYFVWGIHDETHDAVGTTFRYDLEKIGNEDLAHWLVRYLNPRLHLQWHQFEYQGHRLVLLVIPRAAVEPTKFKGTEYVRVGSYCKLLKDYADWERSLWRKFDATPFENLIARERLDAREVLAILDYPVYFDLLAQPLPPEPEKILTIFEADRLIVRNTAGSWDITNLGAILFAKNLGDFKTLERKVVRVVVYEGTGRQKTIREQPGRRGYAAGFNGLIEFLNAILPRNEVIGKALRKDVAMYPELAVRELAANSLIHQDFTITGAGPMIEIFSDRMEITNPGAPLVDPSRLLDLPPRSRNEALASFMRRIGICEERGSGVDKVVSETELYQLPAPIIETPDSNTRVVLFAYKKLNDMDRDDRIRACYMHACLRFVERNPMTNASLRTRFGIAEQNSAIASRIIREAVDAQRVKPFDPDQGKKHARYVPYWA